MPALVVARRNAVSHSVQERVNFLQTDLLEGIRVEGIRVKGIRGEGIREKGIQRDGGFHLILSNPPYISCAEFEHLQEEVRGGDPRVALISGPEGTECYSPLAERSMELLCAGGSLMVEIGAGQGDVVAGIFHQAGFVEIQIVDDLAGIGRVVKGKKKYA
jgi:release factor glutamine methyltransferase